MNFIEIKEDLLEREQRHVAVRLDCGKVRGYQLYNYDWWAIYMNYEATLHTQQHLQDNWNH